MTFRWDLNYLNVKSNLGGPNIFWRGPLLNFKTPTNVLDQIIEIFWILGGPFTQQRASTPDWKNQCILLEVIKKKKISLYTFCLCYKL